MSGMGRKDMNKTSHEYLVLAKLSLQTAQGLSDVLLALFDIMIMRVDNQFMVVALSTGKRDSEKTRPGVQGGAEKKQGLDLLLGVLHLQGHEVLQIGHQDDLDHSLQHGCEDGDDRDAQRSGGLEQQSRQNACVGTEKSSAVFPRFGFGGATDG